MRCYTAGEPLGKTDKGGMRMLVPDRQQAILDFLREKHSASVAELSRMFFISETSIRRDLAKLERSGFVRKTYGGAILLQGGNTVMSLEARQQTEKEAKNVIARKAAALVRNGDVIFLDSSSTALAMVPYLARLTSLSIITHGVKIAVELSAFPQLRVYCVGGLITPNLYSCNGTLACQMIDGMRADRFFVSPKAVTAGQGVYCANEEEATVRRMMMRRAGETVLLCNANKLDGSAAFHLCSLDAIHAVVCDRTPDSLWLDRFAELGITVC